MKYTISIFCLLSLFWLGNSGHYSILLLTLGLVSVIFVILVAHRMDVIDHESQPLHLMGRKLPSYYGWLIYKIVMANVDVVYRIWWGKNTISPTETTLPLTLETAMGKVIYANSITLTPGTVAMDLGEQGVLVHSLTKQGIEELHQGEMHRRVMELER